MYQIPGAGVYPKEIAIEQFLKYLKQSGLLPFQIMPLFKRLHYKHFAKKYSGAFNFKTILSLQVLFSLLPFHSYRTETDPDKSSYSGHITLWKSRIKCIWFSFFFTETVWSLFDEQILAIRYFQWQSWKNDYIQCEYTKEGNRYHHPSINWKKNTICTLILLPLDYYYIERILKNNITWFHWSKIKYLCEKCPFQAETKK